MTDRPGEHLKRPMTSAVGSTIKKATAMVKGGLKEAKDGASPSQLIEARIEALNDWRGETLAWEERLRKRPLSQ